MKFSEIIDQARALFQRKGRMSYRALKLEFDLDDDQIDVLKEELIAAERVARDENDKVLVWTGTHGASAAPSSASESKTPLSYTPPHLVRRILAEHVAMETRGPADGERKTITALFADLKGSTALIEGLDPEEAQHIIDPALHLMMDAVHRYEGYVAQALGDGIFALFGAPIAHEDHPQRALYAALQLQETMRAYSEALKKRGGPPLQVRVGVNTGEVVVRSIRKDDLHTDYVPVGHSTNIAARMEQLAAPGSTLVTEQTYKLTDGYFDFKALGETQVKGIDAALNIYELIGTGSLRTKLQVSARRGLSRFVGREREIDKLQQALAQAQAGYGQIVGVMGEPGLGKSRLFHEFKLTLPIDCLVLEAFAVSHGKSSPYLPVIDLLKGYFGIAVEDDNPRRHEKITTKVLALDRSLDDTLPYLFALMGIDDPASSLQQMDPQIRRRRTFNALNKLFTRESSNQPLIIIFEDLHWIDNETQGVFDALSEHETNTAILLLVNYRPEYRDNWVQKAQYSQVHLTALASEEAAELLTFLLDNDASLTALKQVILERAEGTPFFMEEVVQTLAEEDVLLGGRGNYRLEKAPSELHISPTVQGVLAARIDRLMPTEKALLQRLSVIGREFSYGLARKVVTESDDELHRLLSSLQAKEFLYEQAAFPDAEYIFKHALTQEVAYGTVLRGRRKTLHEQTANAIEALYSAKLEDHYTELAHHYALSGNVEKALEYLRLAGQQAKDRSANEEAIAYLNQGLALVETLEDTSTRAQQELTLQMALGAPLMASKGWAAPEVGQTYNRAHALCKQLGETPELFGVLAGLFVYHVGSPSPLGTARDLAEQLLRLAEQAGDSTLLLIAHSAMADVLFFQGEMPEMRVHVEQTISLYDPQQHHVLLADFGIDIGSFSVAYSVAILWLLGYPDQAQTRAVEALTMAEELAHPYTIAYALNVSATLHAWRGEVRAAEAQSEASTALSGERGFTLTSGWGNVVHGWALAETEHHERGIDQACYGLDIYRASGTQEWMTHYLALLAKIYGKANQADEELTALVEAQEICNGEGECWYEAELCRLRGELTLSSSKNPSDSSSQQRAEEWFQKALEIARGQSAKSWELRAATSLARLWQRQGKEAEAQQSLFAIYNWFTEGFDTKDLQEAKALLAELR